MTNDQIEFLISQYIDGTISGEDEAILRSVLAENADARALLAEYEKLDQLMKGTMPLPAMKWEKVSEVIGAAVDDQGSREVVSEEDEFAISEYLDGTLSSEDLGGLERRMEAEPALRGAMKEYLSLDRAMKQAMPMPAVKWDILAERLSESIDTQSQRSRMFIGNWMKQPMRLAAAAVFILGLGLAILITLSTGGEQRVVTVDVNTVEKSEGAKVAVVEFDMSPSLASSGTDLYAPGGVVAMPSRLDVAISRPINDGPSPF
jgi:anti-sigma factor RsiW